MHEYTGNYYHVYRHYLLLILLSILALILLNADTYCSINIRVRTADDILAHDNHLEYPRL
jgi:hypothetical protein